MAGATPRPVSFRTMTEHEEIWLPLVDEPIGSIVAQLQADDPEIERLVGSPRRILAFRTFAYIRVGMKLGELLVDHDLPPYDGTDSWVELLLRDPGNRAAIAAAMSHGTLLRGDRRRIPGVDWSMFAIRSDDAKVQGTLPLSGSAPATSAGRTGSEVVTPYLSALTPDLPPCPADRLRNASTRPVEPPPATA